MKKKFSYWISLIFLLAVGVGSWSIYNLINSGVADILNIFGIENFYYQNLIIVIIVFIVLIFSGYGIKRAINKLIK